MKTILLMLVLVSLNACTASSTKEFLGHAAANAADTQVGYNQQQCFTVKNQCVQGHYETWQTSDGVEGCSCKNL
ncbi:hypothetical protein Q4567_18025 [Aliiglaciecola sp. 2_MG-2023]|uniref:hypothetical protein n=1 Tax=Alteromonadaceae TaxID=72275 RepID=UPI0026E42C4D|nr:MULTISPECIES: hypothetical protein [unclassified Aliiglaciecola]MDO6712637.1 hypothetical protein [Aliiglaciecola sp. 2_MG-2023]MDO6753755.1 hypothetical protein [Aliiglaciecola sp. 1_MG-2023]